MSGTGAGPAIDRNERVPRSRDRAAPVEDDPRWDAGTAAAVLVAITVGLFRQGGYPTPAQFALAVLLAAACLSAAAAAPPTAADLRWPPVPAGAALAAWALADGALHGRPASGVRPAVLVLGVVAVLLTCRRLGAAGRDALLGGVLTVGVAVAAAGWFGVVAHRTPLGWPGQGLWRAASTLTYPNATAAVLVLLAMVALGRLTDRPGSVPLGAAATVLLLGAGATLSRAGLVAGVAGLGVLTVVRGARLIIGAAAAPVAGAALALAGLLPSLPESAPAHPAPAVLGLAAGLLVGALLPAAGRRMLAGRGTSGLGASPAGGAALRAVPAPAAAAVLAVAAELAVVAVLAVAAVVGSGPGGVSAAIRALWDGRAAVSSPDRLGGAGAALRELADQPVAGAGPGLAGLRWADPAGGVHVLRYAHDEYLQVGAELGTVGLVLLAAFLLALVVPVARAPAGAVGAGTRAGVLAGAAALAVHSAFDFVWHLPAIPLTAAVLVGIAGPALDAAIRAESVIMKGES